MGNISVNLLSGEVSCLAKQCIDVVSPLVKRDSNACLTAV
jgi:hypothetical protein